MVHAGHGGCRDYRDILFDVPAGSGAGETGESGGCKHCKSVGCAWQHIGGSFRDRTMHIRNMSVAAMPSKFRGHSADFVDTGESLYEANRPGPEQA